MNIIKSFTPFFKKSRTTANQFSMENVEREPNSEITISEDLFVDKEEPAMPLNKQDKPPESPITGFLGRNYHARGYEDGYRYHSVDVLDNTIRTICTEFNQVLEKMRDEKNGSLSQLRQHAVTIRNVSAREAEKIDARIVDVEEAIRRIEEEMNLSSMKEGLIAMPISLYRDGFFRGLSRYNDETLLLSNGKLF